jgi:hypothetical protein
MATRLRSEPRGVGNVIQRNERRYDESGSVGCRTDGILCPSGCSTRVRLQPQYALWLVIVMTHSVRVHQYPNKYTKDYKPANGRANDNRQGEVCPRETRSPDGLLDSTLEIQVE